MTINNVGYNHFHDADFLINRPNGSEDYLMLLIKTPAVFVIDGTEQTVSENSIFLYDKGTPQHYKALGHQFGNDWFHFDFEEKSDTDFFDALDIPLNKPIILSSLNELSLLISMMSHEKYSTNIYRTDSIDILMKLFFIKLSEKIHISKSNDTSTNYEKLSILRSKIYNMPYLDWNIEGMSHELRMSHSSFQHQYKKVFGTTAIEDVITARIEHAKYLLTSTNYTVGLISQMCGYSSQIHFMRQFKQKANSTPLQYRNTHKA